MKKKETLQEIKKVLYLPSNQYIKERNIKEIIDNELASDNDDIYKMALESYKKLDKESETYEIDRLAFIELATRLLVENHDNRLLNYIIKG